MQTEMHGEKSRLLFSVAFVAPLLALTVYWFCLIRPHYFPSEDEFALIVASTRMFHPAVGAWFLEGFSHYFIGYQGLSQPVTDFIRPVVNGAYYLNSLVFGSRWACYLLLTYAVQAGLVWLSVKLAVQAAGLPRRMAALVGLMVFLSPAFGWQQMFLTSFTFDLFGALFVLGALHEMWRERYVSAWVLLLLAVFTKETTLFAPVVTALLVWLPGWKISKAGRRIGCTLIWLAPVLAWAVLRHFAFHGHAGVYVLKSAGVKSEALGVLHGFLAWPFGTRTARQSVELRYLFFPLNGIFWAGCGAALIGFLRRPRTPRAMDGVATGREPQRMLGALVLFCAGALAMPVLLNLPQRFGACFFPVFFLLLAMLACAGRTYAWDPRGKMRAGAVACLAIACMTAVYQKVVDPVSLRTARLEWALAESYIQAIHASDARYLLLMNDASGAFTSPALVARFAGYKGTLARVNNLEVLSPGECGGEGKVTAVRGGEQMVATSTLRPRCGFYTFDSVPPEVLETGPEGLATRVDGGLSLRIFPPEAQPLPVSGTPGRFGTLQMRTSGPWRAAAILVPNVEERIYREVRYP